jgi:hypothetical protein
MPKQPIDYSKTIIYRIVCKNPEIKECYVGSTTDFKSRKQNHKNNCNRETSKKYNYNIYTFIREHNGWDNWVILEIEKYKAIDQPDQAKRERFWLEFYSATLNSQVPSQTKQEYEEYQKKYHKKYKEENKEQLKEYQKEYREENIDNSKEYNKKYREKNKEQITCCCGSELTKQHILRHERSKKHIQFMQQNK